MPTEGFVPLVNLLAMYQIKTGYEGKMRGIHLSSLCIGNGLELQAPNGLLPILVIWRDQPLFQKLVCGKVVVSLESIPTLLLFQLLCPALKELQLFRGGPGRLSHQN